ncbi:hypothetical protein RIF29_42371 [Crotalaria pallida]|uniref:Uncharacterized protein n=1 Tax=Crotalaria pallida TaxID=3830 RepID=A0AAN9HW90_CROPI
MFDFGEVLTVESSRIPLLFWIQLIVFLLLLLLLFFCLSAIASDHPSLDSPAATTASESAIGIHHSQRSLINHHSTSTPVTNCLQNTRGGESVSIKGEIEIATSASTGIVREEIAEREASPLYFLRPCYYFRLARVAFLKCLGLDSTTTESDGPLTTPQKHRKRKES